VHLHVLVLDAVYRRQDGAFVRVSHPTTEEVQELLAQIRARVERLFAARGLGSTEEDEEPGDATDDDLLARVQADAVAGRGARRRRGRASSSRRPPPRCAAVEGYTLHAGVGIAPWTGTVSSACAGTCAGRRSPPAGSRGPRTAGWP
jgi:hypothetical protein